MQISIKTVLVLFLVAAACIALWFYSFPISIWLSSPSPVGTWKRHRTELTQFAESALSNSDENPSGLTGPAGPTKWVSTPNFLANSGVKHTSKIDGVVIIGFEFMPTDPVPELIYSPKGRSGLPGGYLKPDKHYTYFKLEALSDKWFYCEWDN